MQRINEIKTIMRQLKESKSVNESLLKTEAADEEMETENDSSKIDLILAHLEDIISRFEKVLAPEEAENSDEEEEPAEDEESDEEQAEDEESDEEQAEDEESDEEQAEESYERSLEDRLAALERRFTEARRRNLCRRFTR